MKAQRNERPVRLNMQVKGEPAKWLNEWKSRGLIINYTDAVYQALRALNEKITEQDLRTTQLSNIRTISEEAYER